MFIYRCEIRPMETLLAAVAVQFSSASETFVIIECAHTLKQGNRLKEGLNTLDRTICQINRSPVSYTHLTLPPTPYV